MAYDFQALKPHLKTYADTHLQASPKAGPDYYECPFCSSGSGPNGTGAFHLKGDRWTCFACAQTGDITDLHAELCSLPRGEAALDLAKTYGLQITDGSPVTLLQAGPRTIAPAPQTRAPSPTASYGEIAREAARRRTDYGPWLEALAATPLTSSTAAVAYLQARGLDPQQMEGTVLLWDGNARAASAWRPEWNRPGKNDRPPFPSLVIPYADGKYWHARILREWSHKWEKPPVEIAGKEPHLGTETRLTSGQVYIVEGLSDALVLQTAGQAVICLSGVSNARHIAGLLSHESYRGVEVVEALDLDKDGRNALTVFRDVYKRPVYSLWDYVDVDLEGIKDPGDLAARSQTALPDAISRVSTPEARYLSKSVGAGLTRFLAEVQAQDPSEKLSTGFSGIDAALDGGLYPGLYILGALSSLGKTTLALQIADNVAASGLRDVLVISLEQGKSELTAKSLSRLTRCMSGEEERRAGALTSRRISTYTEWSSWTEKQQATFQEALQQYQDNASRLWIEEGIGNIGVSQIQDLVELHTQRTGRAPFVVVDYLQILAPVDTRSTDKANTDKAVTDLKRLSRDYRTPVLAISSLNRASYSRQVSMEAFKESGAIEYGSDVLLGLQTHGLENDEKARDSNKRAVERSKRDAVRWTELTVLKNRNGAIGEPVRLKFEAMFSYFEEPSSQETAAAAPQRW